MTEDYSAFLQKSLNLKKLREDRSREVSRETLFKSAKKKLQTTMIGALSSIEEGFGFLWGFTSDDSSEMTPEQRHLKDIYEDARAKILDRGNTQIRNLEIEFANYEINRKKHYINLPVMQPRDQSGNQSSGEQNEG
jgi:transcription termination factor Rho